MLESLTYGWYFIIATVAVVIQAVTTRRKFVPKRPNYDDPLFEGAWGKYHKAVESRNFRSFLWTTAVVCTWLLVTLGPPFLVDFAVTNQNMAFVTFDDDGKLIYHTDFRWAPFWEGREDGTVWPLYMGDLSLFEFQENSNVMITDESNAYAVRFSVRWHLEDPEKFYRVKSRRKGFGLASRGRTVSNFVQARAIDFHIANLSELQQVARECLPIEDIQDTWDDAPGCDALSRFVEMNLNPLLEKDGLRIEFFTEFKRFFTATR